MSDLLNSVFTAASNDDSDAVEEYISTCGNDVNEIDDLGLTGLHRCATSGSVTATHLYLTHGANNSLVDRESGWTALHRSIYFQHVKVTLLMLAFEIPMEDSGSSKSKVGSLVDKDGLSPMALLSRILAPNLRRRGEQSIGAVYCFGKSDFTLGIPLPNAPNVAQAKRVETLLDKRILQLCAGKHHSLAVTQDGHLYSWGYGRWGRLGQGNEVDQPDPCLLLSLLREKVQVVQVASGEHHTIAVTRQGDVFTWGSDRYGQLGHGTFGRDNSTASAGPDRDTDNILLEPRRVEALRRVFVLQVAAGDAHSLCFAKQDELYAWGSNKSGQLGLQAAELSHLTGGAEGSSVPKMVHIDHARRPKFQSRGRPRAEVMLQIAASHNNSLLLCRTVHLETLAGTVRGTVGSEVFQWGHGIFDPVKVQFGAREPAQSKTSTAVSASNDFTAVGKITHVNIAQVAAGQHCFAGISTDGLVYTWLIRADSVSDERATVGPRRQAERVDEGISARSSLSIPKVLDAMLPEHGGGQVTHIAASGSRMSATTADGDVFLWGMRRTSSSKDGMEMVEPRRVASVKRAVAVSLGAEYTLVLVAVSLPLLPLADCPVYSTCVSAEVAKRDERVSPDVDDDYSVGSADHEAPSRGAFLGLVSEPEPSSEANAWSRGVVAQRHTMRDCESEHSSDAGGNDEEESDTVPSLFSICQRQVAKTVNTKTVLSALTFADNFDAKLLSAYCTSYAQMNFDLILAQTKQVEIKKFVEGMGFTLQPRAGTKSHSSPTAASIPQRATGRAHNGSIGEGPTKHTNAPVMTAETKSDPDNSEDVKKQMRGIRKKLAAIQELQDKLSTENGFVLSPQQSEKIQKREQLHLEMAHLEQLLVRCEVRERNAGKSAPTSDNWSATTECNPGAPVVEPAVEAPTKAPVSLVLAAAPPMSAASSSAQNAEAVPKKSKKFPKGMSLQEFHRVLSSTETSSSAMLDSSYKLSSRTNESKSSPWGKAAASTTSANVDPITISLTPSRGSASPSKALPNSIPISTVGNSSPSAAAVNSRKTFTLTDFLPGSARKVAPPVTPTVKATPATPTSKQCWGRPACSPSVQGLPGPKSSGPTKSAVITGTATATVTAAVPTNFSDIQRAEEAARQRSNITSLQGNVNPWYIERRPRAESLENVIRQQALDKAVEEEHQRLKKMYLPVPPVALKKAVDPAGGKKVPSKDSKQKGATTGKKNPGVKPAPGAAK